MTFANVNLWGERIGVVSVERPGATPVFQYTEEFARSGFELSPIAMPLASQPYTFPELARIESFDGLPGLLADSLPDKWGRTLVDEWLDAQNRSRESFDVVERLCHIGSRGMGALEYEPSTGPQATSAEDLEVGGLVELANDVLSGRSEFATQLSGEATEKQLLQLLSIGTSAGGARPKAVIAYNEATGQVRSGQIDAGDGFGYWILKFDGVAKSGDHGLIDPQGWGAVEYAYALMAQAAGIEMTECRLLSEGSRRHFMTRRFDRTQQGEKLHVQTVAALEHIDYNVPGRYSYEGVADLARELGLGVTTTEELYRRMVFNVVARNQDDHVKNFAFTMDRGGQWRLSPAYDITWACKPGNRWLKAHQLSINGKRDDFTREDLYAFARAAGLKRGRDRTILGEVSEAVRGWPQLADEIGVSPELRDAAAASHRLGLVA